MLQASREFESQKRGQRETGGGKPWPVESSQRIGKACSACPHIGGAARPSTPYPRRRACLFTSRVAPSLKPNPMTKGGQFSVVARGHFSVAIYIRLVRNIVEVDVIA